MMEKKYENAQKEGEEKAVKLQETIDELKNSSQKVEKYIKAKLKKLKFLKLKF